MPTTANRFRARCVFFTLFAFWSAVFIVQPSPLSAQGIPRSQRWNADRNENHADKSFSLYDPGTETVVDYSKYGSFQNIGTSRYVYVIEDMPGLSRAVGEGVFPNTDSIRRNPQFQKFFYSKELEGSPWDYVYTENLQKSFFKWNIVDENPGVKQYFSAYALERAGLYYQAVKAFQACLIHFPGTYGKTSFDSLWYVGPLALDHIQFILKSHPELGLRLENASVDIINGYNSNPKDDKVVCNPGRLVRVTREEALLKPTDLTKIRSKVIFNGESVKLVRYENAHWQLLVDGKPYIIRGMTYQPNRIGLSPDNGTLNPTTDWMLSDINRNGKIDGPLEAFVDKNKNNKQDADEPTVGDLALLKKMGVNTLKLYHHAPDRKFLDILYSTYGIRVLMGDLLGAYTVGSGANWFQGTDYTDPAQRKKMLESVRKMVTEFKDHPAILMWVLGNENVYGVATNAPQKPKEFFAFANKAAELIKSLDRNHPVMLANGDTLFLDLFAANAPAVDVFGCNSYRGSVGFGQSLWGSVQRVADKPVVITEFGCPAYHKTKSEDVAEALQAIYLKNAWLDIADNAAGWGIGNALGGFVFTWVDEWWKAGAPPQFNPSIHDVVGQWPGPFPDGWMYEEWLGITSLGNGQHSPFLRQLRKAYFVLQDLWTKETKGETHENH